MTINGTGYDYSYYIQMQSNQNKNNDFFSKIDGNGDGSIDESEFELFVDKLSSKSGKTLDVKSLFSATDSNGDGLLSFEEFDLLKPQQKTPPLNQANYQQLQESLFKNIEGNDDDEILSKSQFAQMKSPISGGGGGCGAGGISDIDENSDSEDEESSSNILDVNKDGIVDEKDYKLLNMKQISQYESMNSLLTSFSQQSSNNKSFSISA